MLLSLGHRAGASGQLGRRNKTSVLCPPHPSPRQSLPPCTRQRASPGRGIPWGAGTRLQGCCNEVLQTKWLKQQAFVVTQTWRLEGCDGGISRAKVPLEALEKDLCQASLPASGGPSAFGSIIPIVTWRWGGGAHVCVCVSLSLSLYPDFPFLPGQQSSWLEAHHQDLILTSSPLRHKRSGFQPMKLGWGDIN